MAVASCPGNADCSVDKLNRINWITITHRRLTCSPSGGNYVHSGRACSDLAILVKALQVLTAQACPPSTESTPLPRLRVPRYTIQGQYADRTVRLRFSESRLCGVPRAVKHAFLALFPT
jgi:hypothetical protein